MGWYICKLSSGRHNRHINVKLFSLSHSLSFISPSSGAKLWMGPSRCRRAGERSKEKWTCVWCYVWYAGKQQNSCVAEERIELAHNSGHFTGALMPW